MWLPNNTQNTCWGSLMSLHSSSLTCTKNSRASHTKWSGIVTKETLSTLLCTRLPAGRQVGKGKCCISRPEHLWQPLHNTFGNAWVGIVDHYIYHYHSIQWLKKWTAIASIRTQSFLNIHKMEMNNWNLDTILIPMLTCINSRQCKRNEMKLNDYENNMNKICEWAMTFIHYYSQHQ